MDSMRNRISIEQAAGQILNQKSSKNISLQDGQISFEQILQLKRDAVATGTDAAGALKFSKHADARLMERSINLTHEQMQRLEDGAKRAGAKGIKDSLVIMDNLAFIVNTKNNTVITAMDQSDESENIYTNIDGAVFI